MNTMNFAGTHPYLLSASIALGTWIFNNIITVLITSMPAPTKDSSVKYQYWFKVLNTIIGNLKRAQSTAIESSPNYRDALKAVGVDTPATPDTHVTPSVGGTKSDA
jgi:hypothetical protein